MKYLLLTLLFIGESFTQEKYTISMKELNQAFSLLYPKIYGYEFEDKGSVVNYCTSTLEDYLSEIENPTSDYAISMVSIFIQNHYYDLVVNNNKNERQIVRHPIAETQCGWSVNPINPEFNIQVSHFNINNPEILKQVRLQANEFLLRQYNSLSLSRLLIPLNYEDEFINIALENMSNRRDILNKIREKNKNEKKFLILFRPSINKIDFQLCDNIILPNRIFDDATSDYRPSSYECCNTYQSFEIRFDSNKKPLLQSL